MAKIPATLTKDGNKITINPTNPLGYSKEYKIVVGTGLKDVYGDGLDAQDDSNTFTTGMIPIPVLVSFDINGDDIFSYGSLVTITSTVTNSPTHYRLSRYSDFSDTDWVAYANPVSQELYQIGLNTFYFQVKNDTGESNVLSEGIGWAATEDHNIEEDIPEMIIPDITDFMMISNRHTDESFLESIDSEEALVTITEDTVDFRLLLRVLYPNGGETLTIGDTCIITYSLGCLDIGTPIEIVLIDIGNTLETTITNTVVNAASNYSWLVSNINPGTYKIRINCPSTNDTDESDTSFTIIN